MPPLTYGTSTFNRSAGNFPELPVVNMVVEDVPTETGVTLQSRFGLEEANITMGAGPIKALFQIDGVLDGSLFGISDNKLYKEGTNLGTVTGGGFSKLAGYETYIFAAAGSELYGYDGTTFAEISTPTDFDVLDLTVGAGRLIVVERNSGRFYWSDVLTSNLDALYFATAENSPDKLKACLFIGDTLMLFGTETVEFWPVSSQDPNLPFAPMVGRTYQVGIRGVGCATMIAGTFAWITNRNQICVSDPSQVISNPSIEEKLADSSTASLWTFRLEGVEYLAVRLDTETWVYSTRSQRWSTFESYGETNFIPQCSAGNYLGSSINGEVLQFGSTYSDLGGLLERRFRAGQAIDSGRVPAHSVHLRANVGYTTSMTGTYADPTVELRTSKDGGQEWSAYRARSLGERGHYRKPVVWLGLGSFGPPGVLIEFRVTDPVPFRVSNVLINEPRPGV